MSSISQANYDAKKYPCVPHDGLKGERASFPPLVLAPTHVNSTELPDTCEL